ncbi:MAG: PQQ-dependent sugar dehydrogenase [Ardenticatenaceae bacterium]|nr:PQQ-dependent sugar dehydrogenase [Ardenticatenaceae bacterium]
MSRRFFRMFVGASILISLLTVGGWYFRQPLLARVGINIPRGAGGRADLILPVGFRANVFAEGLMAPRFMALGPDGLVFVADRALDQVLALPDRDGDGQADEVIIVARGLYVPTSLAFRNDELYVGETAGVTRLTLHPRHRHAKEETPVITDLPPVGRHYTRTVLFGPDGRLYVSIGSSCNVCRESDPHRAAVWVYPPDGGSGEPFTVGLRNAVGLAVNPWTQTIWATNNGRDFMGDDRPPDTVYELAAGADAGWPRCHAGTIPDPDFGRQPDACQGVLQPVLTLPAHVAPLGLAFYPRDVSGPAAFPADMQGDLFIALHGSWNRSTPVGYKVVRVPLDDSGRPEGPPEDFAIGLLQPDGRVLGRPVGLLVLPDGSMLVSDDRAGFIYRISRE